MPPADPQSPTGCGALTCTRRRSRSLRRRRTSVPRATDRKVSVYRCAAGALDGPRRFLTPHTKSIRRVRCHKRGLVACCSFDGTVSLWNDFGQVALGTLEGQESEVKGVDFNQNASLIATCARDKSIWLWNSRPPR